jgi:hypothetical protein
MHKTLVIIAFLIILLLITDKKEYFENFNKIKVAVLIITLRGTERYENERKQWKKYMNKYKNVDCYFIECDGTEGFNTIYSKCKESYVPGIFQKTILSLDKVGDNYDYYIRTNLSSFFIIQNLLNKLENISQDVPYYSGVYCNQSGKTHTSWVGGFGIILNKKSRKVLLDYGKKDKYFKNKTADDVLIGDVLNDYNIKCTSIDDHIWYNWNYNKEYNENLKEIVKKNPAIIRLRHSNTKEYNKVCNALFNKFY